MGLSKCAKHVWEREAIQKLKDANKTIPKKVTQLDCPYGKAIFEVTWPNMTRMRIENELAGHGTPSDAFMFMCVCYGYIPYAIGFISIVELFIRRGTRELSSVIFLGLVTILNELIFKNIINQQRPERSCLGSCGMPSGHSTMSIGLLTMCLLDTALRVMYRPESDFLSRTRLKGVGWCRMSMSYVCHEFKQKFTLLPLSAWDELSAMQAVLYASVWSILLGPVPLARIATCDHTTEQVFFGSALGFLEAVCWCYFVRRMQHRCNHLLGRQWRIQNVVVLTHNFALPRFIAEQRMSATPCRSQDPERELLWYEMVTATRQQIIRQYEQQEHSISPNNRMRAMTSDERYRNEETRYLQHRMTTLTRLRTTLKRVQEGFPRRDNDGDSEATSYLSSKSNLNDLASGSVHMSGSKIELIQPSSMVDGRASFARICQSNSSGSGFQSAVCQSSSGETGRVCFEEKIESEPGSTIDEAIEERINADDGRGYTKQEFLDYFGENDGLRRWESSHKAVSPHSSTTSPPAG